LEMTAAVPAAVAAAAAAAAVAAAAAAAAAGRLEMAAATTTAAAGLAVTAAAVAAAAAAAGKTGTAADILSKIGFKRTLILALLVDADLNRDNLIAWQNWAHLRMTNERY
jgi:hypothetical protein